MQLGIRMIAYKNVLVLPQVEAFWTPPFFFFFLWRHDWLIHLVTDSTSIPLSPPWKSRNEIKFRSSIHSWFSWQVGSILWCFSKLTFIKDICPSMILAVLFTIARTWKQPKCPSTDEWIRRCGTMDTVEYYSATKKNEIMPFVATWMDLSSVQSLSRADSLRPHGLQHARLPCPSPTPGACSNSCPSPTISSSVFPFSSHL